MAIAAKRPIKDQVLQIAEEMGYEAMKEPAPPRFRIFGWFRERPFRPDIVVKRDGRSAIVVVRSHPIILYDIFLTDQLRRKEGAEAVVCVSDSAFDRVRGSSFEYAEELGVHLCRLSEFGDALEELLD